MTQQDTLYAMALTRMAGFSSTTAQQLCQALGGAKAVYDHRNDLADVVPHCTPRLEAALKDWSSALAHAEQEMTFAQKYHIQLLCYGQPDYPARLLECADAPLVLYYRGTADLNRQRVVNIVGTRHCTPYGQDLIRHFLNDMVSCSPHLLVVSGLAYGVDIWAHRQALQNGFETVGVLAHGLDDLYPPRHRDTAQQMVKQGGLITEYMSQTRVDKMNFVRRNRIVAGMCDATILVESAAKGGGLITARIAQDYGRSVFAFPGAVGAMYSEGCNALIRDNVAGLITSADDFVKVMGWQTDAQLAQARTEGIERDLFPELSPQEQTVASVLAKKGDMQLNMLAVSTNIAIGQLTALLFQLEMKGVVRPMAGGTYHLLS